MTDDVIDLTEIKTVVNTYMAAVAEIGKWEKIKEDLGKTLKAVLVNHDVGAVDGVPALRLVRRRARRFDTKTFRDDHPELYDFYINEREELALTVVKAE